MTDSLQKAIDEVRRYREAEEASPPTDTVTTMEIASKVDTDKAQCVKMFAELIENQQELPDDMKKVLYDNLWSLYEVEPVKSETITITKAEYDALVGDRDGLDWLIKNAGKSLQETLATIYLSGLVHAQKLQKEANHDWHTKRSI